MSDSILNNKLKQADAYNKQVMRNVRKDYLRKLNIYKKYKADNYRFGDILASYAKEAEYTTEHIITDRKGNICNIIDEMLYNAIYILPDKQKELLILEFWYGVKQADIASKFNVSERTIYNWKQKAFQQIQNFYNGE